MKGVSLVIQLFKHTTNGRNVLIFGAYMSFSVHATNRANHIYLMGEGLTRKAFMMLRYTLKRTITEILQIMVKSLY